MVRVARDKDSGEVLGFWDREPDSESPLADTPGQKTLMEPEFPDTAEIVDLPEHTRLSLYEEAAQDAGGPPGRMWMGDASQHSAGRKHAVRAEKAEAEPADLLEELQAARSGKRANEPLTWADLDNAENGRNRRHGAGRGRR